MISSPKNNDVSSQPILLCKTTVCQLLGGVTQKHVENMVNSGRMPTPVYLGRIPRWNRQMLMEWIDSGCPIVDEAMHERWLAEKKPSK